MTYGRNDYTVEIGSEFSVTAAPDEGYEFVSWYKGEYINKDAQGNYIRDARPYLNDENLLAADLTYSFKVTDNTVICPVFTMKEREQTNTITVNKAANPLKISPRTAKIKYKKMKKGTYKVKVKVQALGNSNYKASAVKKVTFKVKVK